MKSQSFKTLALLLCVLVLFFAVYSQTYAWGWGGFWKCLRATAALTAASAAVVFVCGSAVAAIILDGGIIVGLTLAVNCLIAIDNWRYAKKKVKKYC